MWEIDWIEVRAGESSGADAGVRERFPVQRVRARRLTGAVEWREQGNFEIALYFENSLDCVLVVQGRETEGRSEKASAYGRKVIMCGRFLCNRKFRGIPCYIKRH